MSGDMDEELRRQLGGLPTEGQPPRDLWPQIAWRIGAGSEPEQEGAEEPSTVLLQAEPDRQQRFGLPAWQLLAASIAVAAFTGGSVWMLLSGGPDAPTPGFETTEVAAPATSIPAGLEETLAEYESTVSGLEAILEQGREVLDPETIRVLEENLDIIDEAIVEVREALSQDPGSNVLRRLLTENLLRKASLLRHVAVAVRAES